MFSPGNAFACIVNSHRGLWNGTICRDASGWNCGAQANFREDFCANLDPKCFHLHLFSERGPRFESSEDSLADLLDGNAERLVDQLLVFYARRASEPAGIVVDAKFAPAGAYRVKAVTLRQPEGRGRPTWVVEPYLDGWARFPFPKLAMPNTTHMGFKYARELRKNLLQDLLDEALAFINPKSLPPNFEMQDLQRLKHFSESFPEWSRAAAAKAEVFTESMRPRTFSTAASRGPMNTVLGDQLGRLKTVIQTVSKAPALVDKMSAKGNEEPPLEAAAAEVIPRESATEVTLPNAADPQVSAPETADVDESLLAATGPAGSAGRSHVPEPALIPGLEGQFGIEVVDQLRVAFATKPIVVLAGPPGMGKSWLATHLLDDELHQRSIVVSVGSTWRGREDFIGYVNPVSNEFEPSAFTLFLVEAERAWDSGDHRPRIAVLEEFNLSQPEHWLSDFLVASQFPASQIALRTIPFGGRGMRGDGERRAVYLSPAVRIVATVNNDHTTRPLSPRVLDRSAVVEVRSAVKSIVQLVDLPLDDDQLAALEQVDAILSGVGAGFSVRTALSIREAHALLGDEGAEDLGLWRSIDFVLLQEMLSKVRLLAGEPRDAQLLESLDVWAADQYGSRLKACGSRIADWKSRYSLGDDISVA